MICYILYYIFPEPIDRVVPHYYVFKEDLFFEHYDYAKV